MNQPPFTPHDEASRAWERVRFGILEIDALPDEWRETVNALCRASFLRGFSEAPTVLRDSGGDIRACDTDQDADEIGVQRFAKAMGAKLARKRGDGRGGWFRPDECTSAYLRELLEEHVKKGDPIDIANLAMMIWNREHPNG